MASLVAWLVYGPNGLFLLLKCLLFFCVSELKEVKRFWKPGVFNYRTLTLGEDVGILYVGAREAVFALDMNNIAKEVKQAIFWEAPEEKKTECVQKGKSNLTDCFNYIRFLQRYNLTHLYCCGTFAFQPKCSYIDATHFTMDHAAMEDGRGKCPYDPAKGHTGLIVDRELYSATLNNFLGTEPVILRNLGHHYSMKTEYMASWLNEPNFVGSAFMQESKDSVTGDDDKIYYFFSERAVEYDCYSEQVVSRVARVCKGDVGGARTLQKKWTTFLKARLVCFIPELQLHFNQIQTIFTLGARNWRNTTFFSVFRAQWYDVSVSAICQYNITDIQKVFEGPYKEYREQAQKWVRYSGNVPSPRPGACITNWHRQNGYNSTLELPDSTLNFAKKHPLMDEQVLPQGHKPLLVKKGSNFTQVVVDVVEALDRRLYNTLFIGTDNGWLIKAVHLGSQVHIIEEVQLFDRSQPVESLTISHTKKLLYVGSQSQIAQLALEDCARYRLCEDCLLARDPYCAWDRSRAGCVNTAQHSSSDLVQDIQNVNTLQCYAQLHKAGKVTPKNITVGAGTDVILPCQLLSNLARAQWWLNDRQLVESSSVQYNAQLKALIITDARLENAGRYLCFSEEQGLQLLMMTYQVDVVDGPSMTMEARAPSESQELLVVLLITLGLACLLLVLAVFVLHKKLRIQQEKNSKTIESTIIYPIEQKSPQLVPSSMADSDEKLWNPGNYYYSDGSLKIVPGHAGCQNGGATPLPTANGIPGQPIPSPNNLHSPNRINLGNIRGSGSNGYIRLQLGGEERPDYSDLLAEELRKKLKQRPVLPDSNPEESSV
ncbi:semaphorin-4C [Latimeria chalumnae]|uniref:semaphorin-4C n=1 Tax=Latimeria chalumnae TaxID=7897 RepID=UPI00313EAC52